jgi:hypothetical protein
MTVLDSKPPKSVGHFEENKISVGCRQFLLECCPKLIKTYNFGQNTVNIRQLKNKNEHYCAVRLFIFKVAKTFCQFFVDNCRYFLPWRLRDHIKWQDKYYEGSIGHTHNPFVVRCCLCFKVLIDLPLFRLDLKLIIRVSCYFYLYFLM